MNFHWSLQFIYCLLHLLAWIRMEPFKAEPSIEKLFVGSSTQSPEEKRESLNVVYTEGGSVAKSAKSFVEEVDTKFNSKKLDELDLSIPSSESSSNIKARKGVAISSVVPRKGAPVSSNTSRINSDPPPDQESIPASVSLASSFSDRNISSSINNTSYSSQSSASTVTPSLTSNEDKKPSSDSSSHLPSKPTVTIALADSDAFLKSLKNDRNVIIPVVALVFVPLIVLLALFISKRIEEARGTHYTRMGFLIEDIYND